MFLKILFLKMIKIFSQTVDMKNMKYNKAEILPHAEKFAGYARRDAGNANYIYMRCNE